MWRQCHIQSHTQKKPPGFSIENRLGSSVRDWGFTLDFVSDMGNFGDTDPVLFPSLDLLCDWQCDFFFLEVLICPLIYTCTGKEIQLLIFHTLGLASSGDKGHTDMKILQSDISLFQDLQDQVIQDDQGSPSVGPFGGCVVRRQAGKEEHVAEKTSVTVRKAKKKKKKTELGNIKLQPISNSGAE